MALNPEGFYSLTSGNDNFQVTPGLLVGLPIGLVALQGNDTIKGSSDSEIMNGNMGEDFVYGGGGADTLYGGKDSDGVFGDEGNDNVNGNMGEDFVLGGAGDYIVRGGKGSDLVFGDLLADNTGKVGPGGNDILIGDFGLDFLIGGGGSDIFVLRTDTVLQDPNSADLIWDFDKSSDRIGLTGGITEANILLKSENIPMADVLATPELVNVGLTTEMIRQAYIFTTGIDIDPNGDGLISGTSIGINGSALLGFAINTTPADLSGRFTAVDF
ncbi:calcium-binding protein [Microseira wollei]|uniref:Peptidase S8 and S53, subtilisin, kexin, sedolisin n=1 Tax=Microseira wollei NIES-4236 TaxID=2530354 RepID=A0AAV3XB25_9CYAN|nr:calcium-binding protein [Microseira wollei]GET39378.1 peptidase S8 and S53, subtilisin, kexin, sedolisin [Microseira wollei NIES-4236]